MEALQGDSQSTFLQRRRGMANQVPTKICLQLSLDTAMLVFHHPPTFSPSKDIAGGDTMKVKVSCCWMVMLGIKDLLINALCIKHSHWIVTLIILSTIASNHRNNLPAEISVGGDIPALFPALIFTVRLHSSTLWGSVTWIAVTGYCSVAMIIPSGDITVTRKEFGTLTAHGSVTWMSIRERVNQEFSFGFNFSLSQHC